MPTTFLSVFTAAFPAAASLFQHLDALALIRLSRACRALHRLIRVQHSRLAFRYITLEALSPAVLARRPVRFGKALRLCSGVLPLMRGLLPLAAFVSVGGRGLDAAAVKDVLRYCTGLLELDLSAARPEVWVALGVEQEKEAGDGRWFLSGARSVRRLLAPHGDGLEQRLRRLCAARGVALVLVRRPCAGAACAGFVSALDEAGCDVWRCGFAELHQRLGLAARGLQLAGPKGCAFRRGERCVKCHWAKHTCRRCQRIGCDLHLRYYWKEETAVCYECVSLRSSCKD